VSFILTPPTLWKKRETNNVESRDLEPIITVKHNNISIPHVPQIIIFDKGLTHDYHFRFE